MAASLDDILSAINNMNQNLGRLIKAIEQRPPSFVSVATANAGVGQNTPAKVVGYLAFTLDTGVSIRVPYYAP